MKLLHPELYVDNFTAITPELLANYHKSILFLDVDNTLFIPKVGLVDQATEHITRQLQELLAAGIRIVAISNNFSQDRKDFFDNLAIPALFFARKPFKRAFKKAWQLLADPTIKKEMIVHVGDQVLTDGIGARRYGIDYILVEPINHKHDLIFAMPSRMLEKILELKIKK